jgi:hypothetical protein
MNLIKVIQNLFQHNDNSIHMLGQEEDFTYRLHEQILKEDASLHLLIEIKKNQIKTVYKSRKKHTSKAKTRNHGKKLKSTPSVKSTLARKISTPNPTIEPSVQGLLKSRNTIVARRIQNPPKSTVTTLPKKISTPCNILHGTDLNSDMDIPLNTSTDTDTNLNTDTDTDTDTEGDANINTHTDTDTDTHSDTYTDTPSDTDSHEDMHINVNRNMSKSSSTAAKPQIETTRISTQDLSPLTSREFAEEYDWSDDENSDVVTDEEDTLYEYTHSDIRDFMNI